MSEERWHFNDSMPYQATIMLQWVDDTNYHQSFLYAELNGLKMLWADVYASATPETGDRKWFSRSQWMGHGTARIYEPFATMQEAKQHIHDFLLTLMIKK